MRTDNGMKALNARLLRASGRRFPGATAVPGEGPAPARLMVIGEAPGRDETRLRRPFVGKAGSFFISVLEGALGLGRGEVYITNAVKFWPAVATKRGRTRTPSVEEQAFFLPFLEEEIRLVSPAAILAVGKTAFSALLPKVAFKAGEWASYRDIPVMAVYHPAYLLRRQKSLDKSLSELEAALCKLRPLLGRT